VYEDAKQQVRAEAEQPAVKAPMVQTTVSQALQNIVIPTFDIKLLQPTIFSRYDVRTSTYVDFR
jgi:S-ribosylhomocysteine lyase LuxS involved in autoinducer biosynthesis